jgi:antitoxin MazE
MYHQTSGLFMRKVHIVRWGKSLAVRIPKAVAEQSRLQKGDAVSIKILNGRVELRPAERIPTLEELVAEITPENRHGKPTGDRPWARKSGKAVLARGCDIGIAEESCSGANSVPQALKRCAFQGLNGTTEVVPFPMRRRTNASGGSKELERFRSC